MESFAFCAGCLEEGGASVRAWGWQKGGGAVTDLWRGLVVCEVSYSGKSKIMNILPEQKESSQNISVDRIFKGSGQMRWWEWLLKNRRAEWRQVLVLPDNPHQFASLSSGWLRVWWGQTLKRLRSASTESYCSLMRSLRLMPLSSIQSIECFFFIVDKKNELYYTVCTFKV